MIRLGIPGWHIGDRFEHSTVYNGRCHHGTIVWFNFPIWLGERTSRIYAMIKYDDGSENWYNEDQLNGWFVNLSTYPMFRLNREIDL